MIWWMDAREFISPCRVCGAYRVQGYHWVPNEISGSDSVRKEECRPSDNLEYLEWCTKRKEQLNER